MDTDKNSVISIGLISEISKAISNLTPDRALLFLTESLVENTDSMGALLLTPDDKNNIMVPFVKSYQNSSDEQPKIDDDFFKDCYNAFLELHDDFQKSQEINHEITDKYLDNTLSIWPVMLAGRPQALLVINRYDNQEELNSEQIFFLEAMTPLMGSLFENFRLNNEMNFWNDDLKGVGTL